MTTQPDETTDPQQPLIYRGHLVVRDEPTGAVVCGDYMAAAGVPAETVRGWAEDYEETSAARTSVHAIADFIEASEQRSRHAGSVGAFPDEGTDVAPPRQPRVELRQQVDVNGVEVADLVVRVPASAPDTATAVTAAARALHDAALAVVRVLAVEPADQAGTSS